MAQKSQLITDIRELITVLKKIDDHLSQQTTAAGIGTTATTVLNAASKMTEKMRALIRLKLDGEDVSEPPDAGS